MWTKNSTLVPWRFRYGSKKNESSKKKLINLGVVKEIKCGRKNSMLVPWRSGHGSKRNESSK